jgi:tRNA A-37 threonylcarbamoyl transferase component Bud32
MPIGNTNNVPYYIENKERSVMYSEVVIKRYLLHHKSRYEKEKYVYQNYGYFTPELIAFNDNNLTLVIEKCTPLLDVKNNIKYKDKLWDKLQKLHEVGINHMDISLANVVVHKDRGVLLIDWEMSQDFIGKKSVDLYGAKKSGIQKYNSRVEDNNVCWSGPHSLTPKIYWKLK